MEIIANRQSRVDMALVAAEWPCCYRVLMIAPTSFFADYGCHVRILEEARILHKLGHAVTIATYHTGSDVEGLDIRRALPIPWRQGYEVGSSRHKIAFDALLALKTLRLLATGPYDVIHAHLHEGALIGLIGGKLWGKPVVFDFQGSLTGEMLDHHFLRQDSSTYRLWLGMERWIDRNAPRILTSTTHAQRLLVEEFGCDAERIQVLPDCVNADVFRPAAAADAQALAALRQRLGLPPERKLVVYLGLLAEYQGTGLLLAALRLLVQRRQDVHLLLMGFPGVDVYRRQAQDLGIADYVTFTGRIPYSQAPLYLALGDAAVAPKLSLTEGAGKLLNYMAVGLPTVAFDTPVAREYLGEDGVLAAVGDVNDLARALDVVLATDADVAAFYRQQGLRLRQRAIDRFNWEAAGQQIVDVYRRLIQGKTQPQAIHQQSQTSGKRSRRFPLRIAPHVTAPAKREE
jgi:glycosyltransferase involved in cell wall biosynthesis